MAGAQSIVSGLAGLGVNAVFDAAGRWVADGASWLLDAVGGVLTGTTTVPIGTAWFGTHESVMVAMAAAVVLPMACCAVIQAILHQNLSLLTRSLLLHLPLALLLTGVAVELVHLGLALTDELSARVMAAGGTDSRDLLRPLSQALVASGGAGPAVPTFVLFVAGLLTAVAALGLWLELVVRAAAVTAATLFLPLALAALVWPAVAHWCRRLADTLVALILSKLVVAAVLSLAAGALAGGLGVTPGPGGGISSVVTGVALLLVATTAPFTLLRLVPAVEAGAISHLESARHRLRQSAQAPARAANLALDVAAAAGSGGASGLAAAAGASVASGSLSGPGGAVGSAGNGFPPGGGGEPSDAGGAGGGAGGGGGGGLTDSGGADDDDPGSSIGWHPGTPLKPASAAVWKGHFDDGPAEGTGSSGRWHPGDAAPGNGPAGPDARTAPTTPTAPTGWGDGTTVAADDDGSDHDDR